MKITDLADASLPLDPTDLVEVVQQVGTSPVNKKVPVSELGGLGGGGDVHGLVPLTLTAGMLTGLTDAGYAVDGIATDSGAYAYMPESGTAGAVGQRKTCQVDLGTSRTVGEIVAIPYWFDNRAYYGARIRISTDASTWTTLLEVPETEHRKATLFGYVARIPGGASARYIEVGLTGSTANKGNHLVELMVLEYRGA